MSLFHLEILWFLKLLFLLHLISQTRLSSQGASWFLFLLVKGSPGEPSGASSCSSSWWFCCWRCCCSTAAGRRTNRTTRRASPSPPAARSTLNTPFQVQYFYEVVQPKQWCWKEKHEKVICCICIFCTGSNTSLKSKLNCIFFAVFYMHFTRPVFSFEKI